MPARWARAVAVLALALVAAATLLPAPAEAAGPRIFRVMPNGRAGADGSSWTSAGRLTDIPRYVRLANPGDEVWIRGGVGSYKTTAPIVIDDGGTATAPVVVRGVAKHGASSVTPVIVGTRTAPYSPTGNPGTELFRLTTGANNLRFHNLAFQNQGNGVFRVGADISNLTIQNMRATNVRRFFEDNPLIGKPTATIRGLSIDNVTVTGYSKGVIRLTDDTSNVVIRNVVGDSQRQDGDPFSMGVHLDDTVHDVLLERVTMRNSHHEIVDGYWNGDGFATERDTYGVRFVDTVATGNADAGYDLKGATTMVRPVAADNKRNYRFTGEAELLSPIGRNPYRRGGWGSQTQVWLGMDARVRIADGTFTDERSDTFVFAVEETAQLTVERTTVVCAPEAEETVVERDAALLRL